jgi:hypothetical protein
MPSFPGKERPKFEAFLAAREKILPWIAEYSPYALVSSDDPPVYLLLQCSTRRSVRSRKIPHTLPISG